MILFIAPLLVLAVAIALVRTIRHDGYGSRPPPRSHLGEGSHAPSYPASSYNPRIIA